MENIEVVVQSLPYLLQGTLVTLRIVVLALALGLCMGLPLAIGQVYGSAPVQKLVKTYVWIFRGLPNLVLLFLFFFGIFPSLRLFLLLWLFSDYEAPPINLRFSGAASSLLGRGRC
jgi:polar amino acid transport system permease protein